MGEAFDAFDERLMELAHFVEEAESLEKGLAGLTALVSHAMECALFDHAAEAGPGRG